MSGESAVLLLHPSSTTASSPRVGSSLARTAGDRVMALLQNFVGGYASKVRQDFIPRGAGTGSRRRRQRRTRQRSLYGGARRAGTTVWGCRCSSWQLKCPHATRPTPSGGGP